MPGLLHFNQSPAYPIFDGSVDVGLTRTAIRTHGSIDPEGGEPNIVWPNGMFENRNVLRPTAATFMSAALRANGGLRFTTYDDPLTCSAAYGQNYRDETLEAVVEEAAKYGPVTLIGHSRGAKTINNTVDRLMASGLVKKSAILDPAGIVSPIKELQGANGPVKAAVLLGHTLRETAQLFQMRHLPGALAVAGSVSLNMMAHVTAHPKSARQEISMVLDPADTATTIQHIGKYGNKFVVAPSVGDEIFPSVGIARELSLGGYELPTSHMLPGTHMGPLIMPSIADRLYDWARTDYEVFDSPLAA